MTGTVDLAIAAPIATIILNSPKRRNAVSSAMWASIPKIVTKLSTDDTVHAVILTGTGNAFAAGADISEFEEVYASQESAAIYSESIATAMRALTNCPKPVIAKIRGACVGGGCALSLCCDIRFADMTAKFAITPAKLGLAYTLEDTYRLVEAVGISRAKDILFSGRLVGAQEARDINLIDFLYEEDRLESELEDYVGLLTANSQSSLVSTKEFIQQIRTGVAQDTDVTKKAFLDAFVSDDFREGYQAFLAKRPPQFK